MAPEAVTDDPGGEPAGEAVEVRLSDGVALYARCHGEPDAPVTVVLLHGWTLDQRTWHHQLADLPAQVRTPVRVVAYDARGHGRSGTSSLGSKTLDRLGDDLAEVLAQLAPDGPVVLVGHSLGGMTAIEYAHRHGDDFAERIAGLVLVATTAEGHTHTAYGLPAPLGRAFRLAETTGAYLLARCGPWRPHRLLTHALRPTLRWLLFGDRCDPADVRLATSAVVRTSLRAIGGFRPSIGRQQRIDTLAALAPVPTAVLVGDRDRLTPAPCARSIAGALGEVTVTTLDGAGHMLMLERPDEVTEAIARVVDEAAPPQPSYPTRLAA